MELKLMFDGEAVYGRKSTVKRNQEGPCFGTSGSEQAQAADGLQQAMPTMTRSFKKFVGKSRCSCG